MSAIKIEPQMNEQRTKSPAQMTPVELGEHQKAEAVAAAQKNLDDAKSGAAPPYVYGFKSKAAMVRARAFSLQLAKEAEPHPEIWQTVIDASYKHEPISAQLVNGMSDKRSASDVRSPREQLIDNLIEKGFVLEGNNYVRTDAAFKEIK